MEHEKKPGEEQIDYEKEAEELEERLRSSIRAGTQASANAIGDTGGLW